MASTRTARAPRLRIRLEVEQLERREVLSGSQPTALEQLMLEEINNARANPEAYGESIGLDLSGVAASQPLAWSPQLVQAAQLHSQDMNVNNFFGHDSSTGLDEGQRLTAVGYPWTSYAESIAAGFATPAAALEALIIDNGVADLDHRRDLLAIDPMYKNLNQVGIGIVTGGTGSYQDYYTIDTASTANTSPFITGVVYNDLNHNGAYDLNEGLGGVTVSVKGGPTTTTYASGGYSLEVSPGTYTVTFSGGGLSKPITTTIAVGQINYRLNVTTAGVVMSYGTLAVTAPATTTTTTTITNTSTTPPNYSAWVQQVAQDLLGAALSTTQVNTYVTELQKGTATSTVVAAIMASPAYTQRQDAAWVTQTGQSILGKALTSAQVTQWTTYLVDGGTQQGVVLSLMNSAYGSVSNGAWMNDLAQGLLGRTLSAVEYSAWVGYLQAGGTKAVAVSTFMSSGEYEADALYQWAMYMGQSILGSSFSSSSAYNYVFAVEGGTTKASVVNTLLLDAAFSTTDHV